MEPLSAKEPNLTPPDDAPLVFQFSKSKPLGINAQLNGNRLAMAVSLAGNAGQLKSGQNRQNLFRSASALLGFYANIIEMICSNTRPPTLGELSLVQGNWEYKNGNVTSYIKGELPEKAYQEIEKLIEAAALPTRTITVDYDKKTNQTKLIVPDALFPTLQKKLHEQLTCRQETFAFMMDNKNWQTELDKQGQPITTGIHLDGLPEDHTRMLKEMLKNDFDIHTDIVFKQKNEVLEVQPKDQSAFNKLVHAGKGAPDKQLPRSPNQIRVPSGVKDDYNPGFIETMTRPDKHPKQHGLMVGAILSNALRIGAGFKVEKVNGDPKKASLEAIAATLSMISYVIDYQPEIKKKDDTHVVATADIKYGTLEQMGHNISEKLNAHPLLASLIVKLPITALKIKDAANMQDDAKMFSAWMNGVRAVVSAPLSKGDYGRG